MLGMLQLIHHGDGEILHRNPTLALRVEKKLVSAQTELARALAGREFSRG
jgi:hypothetical protein